MTKMKPKMEPASMVKGGGEVEGREEGKGKRGV
jgi:hypothetical protein